MCYSKRPWQTRFDVFWASVFTYSMHVWALIRRQVRVRRAFCSENDTLIGCTASHILMHLICNHSTFAVWNRTPVSVVWPLIIATTQQLQSNILPLRPNLSPLRFEYSSMRFVLLSVRFELSSFITELASLVTKLFSLWSKMSLMWSERFDLSSVNS